MPSRPLDVWQAAAAGEKEILEAWARSRPLDTWVCALAAYGGHLPVLVWLKAQGCPWDAWTCHYAAWNNHVEVLQWAWLRGCPWDARTCAKAAEGGSLDALRWLRSCDPPCPWDLADCCLLAAFHGHWELLDWLNNTQQHIHSAALRLWTKPEGYQLRRDLMEQHYVQWMPGLDGWLAAVDQTSRDVFTGVLCPDLVGLVLRFT